MNDRKEYNPESTANVLKTHERIEAGVRLYQGQIIGYRSRKTGENFYMKYTTDDGGSLGFTWVKKPANATIVEGKTEEDIAKILARLPDDLGIEKMYFVLDTETVAASRTDLHRVSEMAFKEATRRLWEKREYIEKQTLDLNNRWKEGRSSISNPEKVYAVSYTRCSDKRVILEIIRGSKPEFAIRDHSEWPSDDIINYSADMNLNDIRDRLTVVTGDTFEIVEVPTC
jgi:hypothetical protein